MRLGVLWIGLLSLCLLAWPGAAVEAQEAGPGRGLELEVDWGGGLLLSGRVYDDRWLELRFVDGEGRPRDDILGPVQVSSGGASVAAVIPALDKGVIRIKRWRLEGDDLLVEYGGSRFERPLPVVGWACLLPPLAAVLLALLFRQVLLALFGGIWLGRALLISLAPSGGEQSLVSDGFGFFSALSETIVGALADADHAKIIVFTLLMGGMVGIISSSGAMRAVVELIAGRARSARSAQVSTWLMGLVIFFDDYANTLLVGSTMRPFTDRLRVSREKLAYIVDSTAAPVAALFFVSTWIGYEVGLIDSMLESGLPGRGYDVFLKSIPYRFYSIFCLVFVGLVTFLGRDFGPMLRAEQRARSEGKVLADDANPLMDADMMAQLDGQKDGPWWLALAPVAVLAASIVGFLFITGYGPAEVAGRGFLSKAAEAAQATLPTGESFGQSWQRLASPSFLQGLEEAQRGTVQGLLVEAERATSIGGVLSEAASYDSLVWGAGLGALCAFLLVLLTATLKLDEALKAFVDGLRSMVLAVVVLLLAWSLGQVCKELLTGEFIAGGLSGIQAAWLPTLVFLLSALIAFSTGTSWGTMAIVFPVLGPLLVRLTAEPNFESVMLGCVGAVLAGACFGDHSSPISDTTVLSSMASGSDHIDHVKTQLPYAACAAGVAVVLGFIPVGFGVSPWLCLPLGCAALLALLLLVGVAPEGPGVISDSEGER